MATVIYLSLDYDGCADILFDTIFNDPELNEIREHVLTIRLYFLAYLLRVINHADVVVLCVGSIRQSIWLDEDNQRTNQNGLCFSNYKTLCDKHGWEFNHLLLADITNKKPPGTAMHDESLQSDIDTLKIKTLTAQIQHAKANYPNDIVKFHFFDDDPKDIILKALTTHFTASENSLPHNIQQVTLMKYDWWVHVWEDQPPLSLHANISNPNFQNTLVNTTSSYSKILQTMAACPIVTKTIPTSITMNDNALPEPPSDEELNTLLESDRPKHSFNQL